MKEPIELDYLRAALCLLGAAFFVFRSRWIGAWGARAKIGLDHAMPPSVCRIRT